MPCFWMKVPHGLGGEEPSGDHRCGGGGVCPNRGPRCPALGVGREPGPLDPPRMGGGGGEGKGKGLGLILQGWLSGLGFGRVPAPLSLPNPTPISLAACPPPPRPKPYQGIVPWAGRGEGPVCLKAFNAIKTSGLGSIGTARSRGRQHPSRTGRGGPDPGAHPRYGAGDRGCHTKMGKEHHHSHP